MSVALYIIGGLIALLSIVFSFDTGSFLITVLVILGGLSVGLIFFSLAKIIENQEDILNNQNELLLRTKTDKNNVSCKFCGQEYDQNAHSYCPYCGKK